MDNTKMTLGSLFDGSGGFPLGGILRHPRRDRAKVEQ